MSPDAQVKSSRGRPGNPAAGLILFALGAARVPPEPPLPGPALIALVGDLGLSEAAGRSAILRMRRGGWLVSRRTGRTVSYAPSAPTLAGHRRRENAFAELDRAGGRQFHALLVSVPERNRAFRDELRRAAHVAGYRTLRAGLLVAPTDRRPELGDLLDRAPRGASVVAGRLELAPADASQVASELWALPDLAARYRVVAAQARAATTAARVDHPAGAAAFRALAAALLPVYEAIADDPGLPGELLPPAWPAAEVGAALGGALRVLGPPVSVHIDDLRRRARAGRG